MSAITGSYVPAGQGWRLAYSLVTLAHELAAVYGDDLTCLGTVGDISHQAEGTGSDHNPFIRDPAAPSIGIVRAIDLGGSDALLMAVREHIWTLYATQDSRVYEYGYSKGCSDNLINNWGLPFGTHVDLGDAGHLHISVTQVNGNSPSSSGYVAAIDSTAAWGFGTAPSGGGTPIGDDMLDANDPLVQRLLKSADLLNYLETSGGFVSSQFTNDPDTRTRIGLIQYQLGVLLAQSPPVADGDVTELLAAINALPAATVAAIKEAL